MKSNLTRMLVTFILVLTVSGMTAPGAVSAATVLRFGCVQNIDHVYNLGVKKLAQLLEERTDGQIKIQIYPDSRLGTNPAMLDQVKTGMLAMGQFPPGTLGEYDERIAILSLYYLFDGFQEMKAALKSPAMKKLEQMYLEKTGIRVLGHVGGLERNIITKQTPVNKAEDLKGLKMRAWSWRPSVEWWQDFGAIPAVISYKEVYTGLQTGVVDGAENELSTFDTGKWCEVAKNIALTQHIYTIRPIVINEDRFQKLTPEEQGILMKAMDEATEYELSLAQKQNIDLVAKLKEKYKDVTFTEPDKTGFKKISRDLALRYAQKVGAEEIAKEFLK